MVDYRGIASPQANYWPYAPWRKQKMFTEVCAKEVFYGGAAAGAKTSALLMAALSYVHVPGYAALILRRDFKRLSLPNSIMDRCKQWLRDTDARWNGSDNAFRFPASNAIVQFGYIDNPEDRFRYASSEFQTIIFEEMTEFRLADDETNPYLFMFSRLRKTQNIPVPLRMLSASNPGNVSHGWVKKRFITREAETGLKDGKDGLYYSDDLQRCFVPARVRDNPAVNAAEYEQNLIHLPPITRKRLMDGDWSVSESLQIPEDWFKYFVLDRIGQLAPTHERWQSRPEHLRRFATIDTAGTSSDRAKEVKGNPSWSVCCVWDYHKDRDMLYLRDVYRARVAWGDLKMDIQAFLEKWNVPRVLIENAHLGQALKDELRGRQCELVGPVLPGMAEGHRGAKLERAISGGLLVRLQAGKLCLPDDRPDWIVPFVQEYVSWSGHPDEQADQIDCGSYACYDVKKKSAAWGGVIRV